MITKNNMINCTQVNSENEKRLLLSFLTKKYEMFRFHYSDSKFFVSSTTELPSDLLNEFCVIATSFVEGLRSAKPDSVTGTAFAKISPHRRNTLADCPAAKKASGFPVYPKPKQTLMGIAIPKKFQSVGYYSLKNIDD